ncbi:glycosyltransferase [Clostridium tetanomorphum]|uniref:Glycosyltransferase family 4 protein n=1 Tax=Clostridium tetanomorphum TaxID=1553 RepID=A0A923EB47_CLOTT|nr:glycosyltransferase [Clostridium tetanomorphum]MBC2397113.1 glycosyltransferase family 4 protein [Clostridium tetanomorphum]NRZ99043.1 glycosyltransferase involved in cell wall biosynthesis [Clostridium tetanomorphum]
MKKLLFITPNDILESSGGGINVKKLYLAVKKLDNIDIYIYSPSKVDESYILANKNKKNDIYSRLRLHSNYLYIDWEKNKEKVYDLNPDIVLLTNSRLGFIAKDLKEKIKNCKVITQFDNIEYDYCIEYMNKYAGIKRVINMNIEKICVKRDEKTALLYSDCAVFLTIRDQKRANDLYNVDIKSEILPICIEKQHYNFNKNNNKYNLVFLASLWYKPNEEGILWFIDNVWKNIVDKNISLIIGGKKPSKKLLRYNDRDNIKIYPNYKCVSDIVPINSIFISPIFTGAGMKVKVAEALSMGYPVIASNEALEGYEEIIYDCDNISVCKANNSFEFIEAIQKISRYHTIMLKNNSKYLFNKYYSLDRAIKCLEQIISYI